MRIPFLLSLLTLWPAAAQERLTATQAQEMLRAYCSGCHGGNSTVGRAVQMPFADAAAVLRQQSGLASIAARVREGSMPPGNRPSPSFEQRANLLAWIDDTLKGAACSAGIQAAPARMRHLTRDEYAASIRDILHFPFEAGRIVPSDPSRANEFDNSVETLNLSPMLAERYIDAAFLALEQAMKNPQARAAILIARPDAQTTPEQAARKILTAFLPLAFRRPAEANDVDRYLSLFRAESEHGESFEEAILHPLQAALASPRFLFLMEEQNPGPGDKPADDYELASRLSYFLWGTMPDKVLFDLAAQGKLNDTATLSAQVQRMLADPKTGGLTERFIGQWLGTRSLGDGIKVEGTPEQVAALRAEPAALFARILNENHSLLELLGSNGLASMPAARGVSDRAGRNGTILRGKWVLETFLGVSVPQAPHVVRMTETTPDQRLQDLACVDCHLHIEPYGASDPPIDRQQFLAHFVRKLYTYALGRQLTPSDLCAAESFVARLNRDGHRAQGLVRDIVFSVPFRSKGVTTP